MTLSTSKFVKYYYYFHILFVSMVFLWEKLCRKMIEYFLVHKVTAYKHFSANHIAIQGKKDRLKYILVYMVSRITVAYLFKYTH